MSSTQPKALRLADALVYWHGLDSVECDAAIELRRLHAQRDALLEALRWIEMDARVMRPYVGQVSELGDRARAAIAAVEGEKTP